MLQLHITAEQAPNPDRRVTRASEKGALLRSLPVMLPEPSIARFLDSHPRTDLIIFIVDEDHTGALQSFLDLEDIFR